MRKTLVLMTVLTLTVFATVALAGGKGEGKVGKLYLFQKCDINRASDSANYDASGCPVMAVPGPWPIIPDNGRWGQMQYNLLGSEFKYSFEGKKLSPDKNYTLIYYPDPYPGKGLICLGSGSSDAGGSVHVHGKMEIPSGLPIPTDANFTPLPPSGAIGAKIWLVLSDDVQCASDTVLPADAQMSGWNPTDYLFEGNLIIYQYHAPADGQASDDGQDAEDGSGDTQDTTTVDTTTPSTPAPQNNGNGNGGSGNNGKGNGQGNAPGKDNHH